MVCLPVVLEYVALYNYSGSAGDLSFKAGDVIDVMQMTGEWWTGTLGNRKGIFPANYVKRKQTRETTVKDLGPVSHARTVSSPVVDGDTTVKRPCPLCFPFLVAFHSLVPVLFVVLAAVVAGYEALGPEQLSLQPGQLIHVKKQNPNGWWEGELQVCYQTLLISVGAVCDVCCFSGKRQKEKGWMVP